MIAMIRRVWPSNALAVVIAIDAADGHQKKCFVWTDTVKGQLIASLCLELERNGHGMSSRQIALTLKPKTLHGYEIEEGELMPLPPTRAHGGHLGATE